ncbi:MAG: aldo/keto reductase [Thermoplasmata archaeon]
MDHLFSKKDLGRIGLGTWQMGMKGWGKDYDDSSVLEAFIYGVRNGLNFVDTAEIYGNGRSEALIGKALEYLDRRKIYLATKLAGYNATPRRVKRSLYGSLKRLGVEYIDLYQVHWEPSIYTNMEYLFRELESMAGEGFIQHIGVSNFSLDGLKKASSYLKDFRIESNQLKFNLIERPGNDIIQYMNENGIKLIAWSPLAQGFLTGKYGVGRKPEGFIRKLNVLFSEKNFKRYDPLIKKLKEISLKENATVTQIVLSYESKLGVLPIPGFKNMNQVKEILGALKPELSEDHMMEITKILEELGTIKAREKMFPGIIPNFLVRTISLFI